MQTGNAGYVYKGNVVYDTSSKGITAMSDMRVFGKCAEFPARPKEMRVDFFVVVVVVVVVIIAAIMQ
jgi:hypothetical protein